MSWRQRLRALACLGIVLLAYLDAQRADDEHYCELELAAMNVLPHAGPAEGGTP